jgi:hypothetical protein
MNAPASIKLAEPPLEGLNTRLHASFVRILGDCPIENRMHVFKLMVRTAVDELHVRKRQIIDNLFHAADVLGVTSTIGETAVREALRVEFQRKELLDDECRTRSTDH